MLREFEFLRIIEIVKFYCVDDCFYGLIFDVEVDWIVCFGLVIMKKEGLGVVIGLFVVVVEYFDDGYF